MIQAFYSIRMRASLSDRHLSGAERIVERSELDEVLSQLRRRALSKACAPDQIVITIEPLPEGTLPLLQALPITNQSATTPLEARQQAVRKLEEEGVPPDVALKAMRVLDSGAAGPGRNMRGAVIMAAGTGERLEPDHERGVRVSRFDWQKESLPLVEQELTASGLGHFRTREALALATKVVSAPGVIAELCWSDDPDYTAGYVASQSLGYVRFPTIKPAGAETGGRIFFVREDGIDLQECISYLERRAVLIGMSKAG